MARLRLAAAFGVAALVLMGTVGAAGTELSGSVGPGFTISLSDGSGATVTRLGVGAFTLTVEDDSDEHNFHLTGPGVNVATEVETQGTKILTGCRRTSAWCDGHAALSSRDIPDRCKSRRGDAPTSARLGGTTRACSLG